MATQGVWLNVTNKRRTKIETQVTVCYKIYADIKYVFTVQADNSCFTSRVGFITGNLSASLAFTASNCQHLRICCHVFLPVWTHSAKLETLEPKKSFQFVLAVDDCSALATQQDVCVLNLTLLGHTPYHLRYGAPRVVRHKHAALNTTVHLTAATCQTYMLHVRYEWVFVGEKEVSQRGRPTVCYRSRKFLWNDFTITSAQIHEAVCLSAPTSANTQPL